MSRSRAQPPSVDLEGKVAFLTRASSYPQPGSVETIETRMSWVFLTRDYVYKLKKPRHDEFVDLRTVVARRRNCLEELRVNRRFTNDVYVDAVPLTRGDDRGLSLCGEGETVDWLVRTRRLPADRMLDSLIAGGCLRESDIVPVVELLCRVYRESKAPPGRYIQRLTADTRAFRHALSHPEFALPSHLVEEACTRQLRFLSRPRILADRAAQIVEGHGDLRPEHICLTSPPQIIDALEFSRDLRTLDAADELGFLALECERLGAPQLREPIFSTYARVMHDHAPDALIHFYQSYRALLRATLAARHLTEQTHTRSREHWLARTRRYVDLAIAHARQHD